METQASVAQQRYAEIFRDVENLINDHSEQTLFKEHGSLWFFQKHH